nr:MAG TPA: hypothetical protein [Siphoviridae sp. cta6m1]
MLLYSDYDTISRWYNKLNIIICKLKCELFQMVSLTK